jgi:nucleotide-binding universal stress UspA family protein
MSGIVVGVDGSIGARDALRVAAEEARAHGETLHVIHAFSVSEVVETGERPPANVELRHAAQAVVDGALEQLAGATRGLDVTTEVVAVRGGNAAQALVHASKGARRLVVGSRGLDGFAGLLVGSVSQQCVQHAACPVLVVPATDDRRG